MLLLIAAACAAGAFLFAVTGVIVQYRLFSDQQERLAAAEKVVEVLDKWTP